MVTDPTGGMDAMYDVTALAFSPSGEFVFTGLQGGAVMLWTMTADHAAHRYTDPAISTGFGSLDLRTDGRRMAVGTIDTGEVLLWDTDPQSPTYATILARLPGHQGAVFPIVYSPDGTCLLYTSRCV